MRRGFQPCSFAVPAWLYALVTSFAALGSIGGAMLLARPGDVWPRIEAGKQIYRTACASCHGADGKGQAQTLAGFERPSTFPDFSDCRGATPEPDVQWRAVITYGGPGRAFSQIMPSFKDAYTQEQVGEAIDYLRSLCAEKVWPRGNLNFSRPMITEKAFPEDEVVVSGAFNTHGAPGGGVTATYEKRIGRSAMIEASVPYNYAHDSGVTRSGFGDIALGYKRKLFDSLNKGSILAWAANWRSRQERQTSGREPDSTVFETYGAYGQMLPADSFLSSERKSNCRLTPTRRQGLFMCEQLSARPSAPTAGLAADGRL